MALLINYDASKGPRFSIHPVISTKKIRISTKKIRISSVTSMVKKAASIAPALTKRASYSRATSFVF